MENFFDKTKKLSQGHLYELAAMCAGAGLLLLVAVFLNGSFFSGKSGPLSALISPNSQIAGVFPCGWDSSCPSDFVYTQSFTANSAASVLGQTYSTNWTSTAPGQSVTFYWSLFGERYANFCVNGARPCTITADAPRSPTCFGRGGGGRGGSGCTGNISGQGGTYTVAPSRTTTYYLCSDILVNAGVGCAASTVYVTTPTPTTLTSLTATPSSVTSGTPVSLTWQGAKGTNFSSCELYVNVPAVPWSGTYWYTTLPGTTPTGPISHDTTFSMDCFDTTGGSTGWQSVTVSIIIPPAGPCTDIPAQPSVPNGCVTPAPAPGICTPAGGSYSAAANTCSCPAGTSLQGSSCVANSPPPMPVAPPPPPSPVPPPPPAPLCGNGLNNSYAPSCTCPAAQYQPLGSPTCTTRPVCANGLSQSYSPSCTCPAGQEQSGSSCVVPGAINSLTANPSRVLKGNPVTVSWSTSHMASCSLSGLDTRGNSTLSSTLSSSLTPSISGKTIFTLTCTDTADVPYSSSVTVNLIPQTVEQ